MVLERQGGLKETLQRGGTVCTSNNNKPTDGEGVFNSAVVTVDALEAGCLECQDCQEGMSGSREEAQGIEHQQHRDLIAQMNAAFEVVGIVPWARKENTSAQAWAPTPRTLLLQSCYIIDPATLDQRRLWQSNTCYCQVSSLYIERENASLWKYVWRNIKFMVVDWWHFSDWLCTVLSEKPLIYHLPYGDYQSPG